MYHRLNEITKKCQPIDYCRSANLKCPENAKCASKNGKAVCLCDYPSFQEHPKMVISTKYSSKDKDGEMKCIDNDECQDPNFTTICDKNYGVCHNRKHGEGYFCTCKTGYQPETDFEYDFETNSIGPTKCIEIPTTTTLPSTLPDGLHGKYVHQKSHNCQPGFTWDSDYEECLDIDECQFNNGNCPAMCMNLFGSYYCYEHMSEETKLCHHNFVVDKEKYDYGYKCLCYPGFHLCRDGFTCYRKDYGIDLVLMRDFSIECNLSAHPFDGRCYELQPEKANYWFGGVCFINLTVLIIYYKIIIVNIPVDITKTLDI